MFTYTCPLRIENRPIAKSLDSVQPVPTGQADLGFFFFLFSSAVFGENLRYYHSLGAVIVVVFVMQKI